MSIDPFIEAEEAAGHSVKNACRLLEVSRAAYYQRRQDVPSAREISDAELTEKITAVHTEAKGTYGSPRVHRELAKRGVECGKRRLRRLMRNAGLEGRCKKRWRKTTIADPTAAAALDRAQGGVLGQCCGRELLRHHQARAHRHSDMADTRRTASGAVRLHRGVVQRPPAAQLARLLQPSRVGGCPPHHRPSGGMINTSNLSVEPDQVHKSRPDALGLGRTAIRGGGSLPLLG